MKLKKNKEEKNAIVMKKKTKKTRSLWLARPKTLGLPKKGASAGAWSSPYA